LLRGTGIPANYIGIEGLLTADGEQVDGWLPQQLPKNSKF
jgi:hypothetical protein